MPEVPDFFVKGASSDVPNFFVQGGAASRKKIDTKSLPGMVALAESTDPDLGRQAREIRDAKPPLSTWQRLGAGLGAFNPAEALLRTSPTLTDFTPLKIPTLAANYAKTLAGGLASAISGKADYDTRPPDTEDLLAGNVGRKSRRTFRDVVDVALPPPSAEQTAATEAQVRGVLGDTVGGIANKVNAINQSVGRGAIGLAGDIFLDPTTYTGLPLLKGAKAVVGAAGKAAAATGRGTLAVVNQASPTLATGLKGTADIVGASVTDGVTKAKNLLGKLLVPAYNTSPGTGTRVLELQGRLSKVLAGLKESNKRRLYDALTAEQQTQLRVLMLEGKRAELGARQSIESAKETAEKVLEGKVARQPEIPGTQQVLPKAPEQLPLGGLKVQQDIPGRVPNQDAAAPHLPLPVRSPIATTGLAAARQAALKDEVIPKGQGALGLDEDARETIQSLQERLYRAAVTDVRQRPAGKSVV